MNKRGQEGYISIQTMEMAFLIILGVFLTVVVVKGIDDQKLNSLKAEDLALSIESLYILNGDLNLEYNFGEEKFLIEENNNQIRVYKNNQLKTGVSGLSKNKDFVFGEQISKRTNLVKIKKEGKKVVIT